ncbi:MAG: PIN domain-containing protein [Acidobacteriota bacterium]|nr:PIN domain-containing protein [Acidobacteriota bacterium]
MMAYVDSSVLLRVILGRKNRLREWRSVETGVASVLVEVECLRTLDRLLLRTKFSDEELASRREAVYRLTEEMEIIETSSAVLARASQPLPTPLGTLDAIHLASAMMWREQEAGEVVMATHDDALGMAARAVGFRVVGI